MDNKVRDGKSLEFVADADYGSGDPVVLGSGVIGIVNNDVAEDATGVADVEGVFKVVKAAGAAWALGDKLYFDTTAKKFTKTATGNKYAGYAVSTQISADLEGQIHLNKSVGENAVLANIPAVSTANASDLATAVALVNALKASYNLLIADLKSKNSMIAD